MPLKFKYSIQIHILHSGHSLITPKQKSPCNFRLLWKQRSISNTPSWLDLASNIQVTVTRKKKKSRVSPSPAAEVWSLEAILPVKSNLDSMAAMWHVQLKSSLCCDWIFSTVPSLHTTTSAYAGAHGYKSAHLHEYTCAKNKIIR